MFQELILKNGIAQVPHKLLIILVESILHSTHAPHSQVISSILFAGTD